MLMSSKERNGNNQNHNHMNFNHEKKHITDAFNIQMNPSEMTDKITDIVREWATSDSGDKISTLGEMMHKELPYEVILLLATKEVHGKVVSSLDELEGMISDILKEQAKID